LAEFRSTASPVRHLYQALAQLIRMRMADAFSDIVTPIFDRGGARR
jgi:LysR family hydrogen peroxide-inducible transcriptional activator